MSIKIKPNQIIFIVIVIALVSLNLYLFPKVEVLSGSMFPTLKVGDHLIIERTNPFSLERGDIVVFWFNEDNTQYIKRLIGLPGDVICILDTGEVCVNGEELYEPYVVNQGGPCGNWEVPAGYFFFLGDNRKDSYDSRSWQDSYISMNATIGKMLFSLPSLDNVKK